MQTIFKESLKADLFIDDKGQVRQIFHKGEYYLLNQSTARTAAAAYFQKLADIYHFPQHQLQNMYQPVSFFEPRPQEVEYRQSEEKTFFDSTTVGYFQTIHNVPVWRAGLSVTIKQNPNRVVVSTNNSCQDVKLILPATESIDKWKRILLQQPALHHTQRVLATPDTMETTANFIKEMLSGRESEKFLKESIPHLIRGRFYAYKYDAENRQEGNSQGKREKVNRDAFTDDFHPTLPLPPVPETIQDGSYYLVAEITFTLRTPQYGTLTWIALVEVETDSVLYLRPLRDNLTAKVIARDPARSGSAIISTGNTATLNLLRTDQVMQNLDAPVMGTQSLRGTYATVGEFEAPSATTPTEPGGTNFNFDVRTNNFAAANAYYHVDQFFRMVESLGFSIPAYFSHTTFPIHVDHRGHYGTGDGIEVNAHCDGNGTDGIQLVGFCLDDLSDTANPLGMSVQYDVTLHELGGHGVLYEHIGSANLPFSHSAGDSVAVIQNDPDSLAADRFYSFPWVRIGGAVADRRHDRDVSAGWGWGGANDVGGYNSEQILSTSHFRIYRSIGGDHPDLVRRQFAASVMTYLILRTISTFTPATSPANALAYCNALMATDLLNWTSEGLFGGAYNKVVRWAFEKQGLFQAAGAPLPVTAAGAPPVVDIYIDDNRHGEYPFQEVHWENLSIWNQRNIADAPVHAEPIIGATNFAYVKVKNRGSVDADAVTVKAYHCLPGAGLTWPTDFTEMPSLGGAHAPVPANSAGEIVFGPFLWIPNTNAFGHDCILMVSSHAQDPSNVDNFTAGESVEEWRLVPNDNNVGQRNVYPVPGGGGAMGLLDGLHEKLFWAGNSFRKPAAINLKVQMPEILASAGWRITFKEIPNNQFTLQPGEKRPVTILLTQGGNFTKQQVENAADKEIRILMYANDMLLGGMTYYLDPNISEPFNKPGKEPGSNCNSKANDLLQCLNMGDNKVKKVCVKKVSLDIEIDNDCCC